MMRRAAAGAAVLLVLGLAGFASFALLPRYPSIVPRKDVWPEEKLATSMNPWFLGDGFSDRIAIEVDWVEGCRPGPHTIEGLRSIAVKYAPAGVPVTVALDEEISRAEWDSASKRADERIDPFILKHAGFAHEPCDPEFRIAHFYVLFAPGRHKWYFGYSGDWFAEGDDPPSLPVEGIVVFHEAHARLAKLWLNSDKMEAMTVVHEYGHQLGLVSNGAHERTGFARSHCTELTCLMAQPTWRVYARNTFAGIFNHFPSDYCERCQEDIHRAQAAWRERLARAPDYRERRAQDRQAWYWSLSIRPLVEHGDYDAALAEIERAKLRYPDYSGLASDEVRCLSALGRFDEAAARLSAAAPDRQVWLRNTLARFLILAGRNRDAIALYDRDELRKLDDYEFQQSVFIVKWALENEARWDDAVSLTDELLAREAISFLPETKRAHRAELLIRAGRREEAIAAVEKGLGSRKTRATWLSSGAQVYEDAGRRVEAQALLREWLAAEEKAAAGSAGKDIASTWRRSWTIASIHARLGETGEARAAIGRAEDPPEETDQEAVVNVEVPVLVKLGDWDRAAELIRGREAWSWYDVCGNRDLAPLRTDPRYADLFAKCSHVPTTPPTAAEADTTPPSANAPGARR